MGQGHGAVNAPSSLRGVVRRAHLGMALMAMALAGSLLLLAGLVALRVNLESNLQLMARSVAYTVEAAVVFKDAEDAGQTLAHMLAHEGVARAVVRDAQGAVFAQWQGAAPGLRARMLTEALQLSNDTVSHIPLHDQVIPWAMKKNVELVHRADNRVDMLTVKIN